jgi:uncharacterized membrane protein YbhN (UPF0104 family)
MQGRNLVAAAIAIALVAYVVHEREALARLADIRPADLLGLSAAYTAYFLTVSRRMLLCLGPAAREISFDRWFRIYLWGRTGNTIAPQAGTALRAVVLKREFGLSYQDYIASFAFYAWSDTVLNLLLSILVLTVSPAGSGVEIFGYSMIWLLAALLAMALAAPVVFAVLFARLPRLKRGWYLWLLERVQGMNSQFAVIASDRALAARLIAWTAVSFMLSGLVLYFAFKCIQVTPNVAELATFVAIINIGDIVQIIPGNIGPYDFLFGVLSHAFGWGMSVGILACLVARANASLVTLALTLIFLRRSDFESLTRAPNAPHETTAR